MNIQPCLMGPQVWMCEWNRGKPEPRSRDLPVSMSWKSFILFISGRNLWKSSSPSKRLVGESVGK